MCHDVTLAKRQMIWLVHYIIIYTFSLQVGLWLFPNMFETLKGLRRGSKGRAMKRPAMKRRSLLDSDTEADV